MTSPINDEANAEWREWLKEVDLLLETKHDVNRDADLIEENFSWLEAFDMGLSAAKAVEKWAEENEIDEENDAFADDDSDDSDYDDENDDYYAEDEDDFDEGDGDDEGPPLKDYC